MKVEVRAFATLAVFLPSPRPDTAAVLNLPEGSTVRDMATALGIPDEMSMVVLVNGGHAEAGRILNPDDVVTLFPPLVGGSAGVCKPNPSCPSRTALGVTSAALNIEM